MNENVRIEGTLEIPVAVLHKNGWCDKETVNKIAWIAMDYIDKYRKCRDPYGESAVIQEECMKDKMKVRSLAES